MNFFKGLLGLGDTVSSKPAAGPGNGGSLAREFTSLPSQNAQYTDVPGLDLTEIYPRVWVSGLPYNAVTNVDACRNNVNDLALFMHGKFGSGNFLMFNLAPASKCSYDHLKFDGQVLNFNPVLEDATDSQDDGLPTVAETFRICYCMKMFLDWRADNVVILHDINGRGRSAFVVACYLAWDHSSEFMVSGALSLFMERRVAAFRRRELPNSWTAMLKAFQTCIQQPFAFQSRKLHLLKFVASMHGDVQAYGRNIVVRVYQGSTPIWDSDVDAAFSDGVSGSINSGDDLVFDEGELKCKIERFVEGDVQILIYANILRRRTMQVFPTPLGHLPDMKGVDFSESEEYIDRRLLVRYAFHTCLMPTEGIITIPAIQSSVDLPTPLIDREKFRMTVSLLDSSRGGDQSPSLQHPLAPARPTDLLTSGQVYLPTGALDWKFAEWLNLTGHMAHLAGVYHLANSHTIIPENYTVEMLKMDGVRETYFALAALQLANRNIDRARFVCHSDYFAKLQIAPFEVPSSFNNGNGKVEQQGSDSLHHHANSTSSGGRIAQMMLPVVATALANLSEKQSIVPLSDHLADKPFDPLAAHEHAQEFLNRNLNASARQRGAAAPDQAHELQVEMNKQDDPLLYMAGLHVASAIMQAERSEAAAGLSSPALRDTLDSFSKLDVHSMTQLVRDVRQALQSSNTDSTLSHKPSSSMFRVGGSDNTKRAVSKSTDTDSVSVVSDDNDAVDVGGTVEKVLAGDSHLRQLLQALKNQLGPDVADKLETLHAPSLSADARIGPVLETSVRQILEIIQRNQAAAAPTLTAKSPESIARAATAISSVSTPVEQRLQGVDASVVISNPLTQPSTATEVSSSRSGREQPAAIEQVTAAESAATTIPSTSPVQAQSTLVPPVESEEQINKFRKMLLMGVPPGAIRIKMLAEGISADTVDKLLAEGKAPDSSESASGGSTDEVADSVVVGKYLKMSKLGIPGPAVLQKASRDGIEQRLIDRIQQQLGISAQQEEVKPAPADPEEAKRRAALQALADARARRIEQLKDEQRKLAADAAAALQDSTKYAQYFRMLRVGVPLDVVEQKMIVAKADPAVLRMDPTKPRPDVEIIPLQSDPIYGKFFRMLKIGLSRDAVEHKMTSEGANVLALELLPDHPTPSGLADMVTGLSLRSVMMSPSTSKPKRQRKKLHWEALPSDRLTSKPTIWSHAAEALDGDLEEDDFFNDEEFDKLFTQDSSQMKAVQLPLADSQAKRIVYLLDGKRGRNVGIGLKKLKLSPEAVKACLTSLSTICADGRVLGVDDLVLLEELLPTPDEAATIKAFRGDKSKLGEAERFFAAVADIPKAKSRASALAFQCNFDYKLADLVAKLRVIASGVTEVKGSARLRKVLEAILKLGNRLNASDDDVDASPRPDTPSLRRSLSAKSVVTAFTLNSLLKLSQTKAFNNKVTLLHYLVARLTQVDPDVLGVSEDLQTTGAAARLTFEMLRSDLTHLKNGLQVVEKLAREQMRAEGGIGRLRAGSGVLGARAHGGSFSALSPSGVRGPIPVRERLASTSEFEASIDEAVDAALASPGGLTSSETFSDFVSRAQTAVANAQRDLDDTCGQFIALLEFFGEDSSMTVETFFGTVAAFCNAFDRAKQENVSEQARAAREARRSTMLSNSPRPSARSAVPDDNSAPASANPSPASTPAPVMARKPAPPPVDPKAAMLAAILARRGAPSE